MSDFNDMFIMSNLPKPLSNDCVNNLIIQVRNGDGSAKEKIALHNVRLVINIVLSKFNQTEYDTNELVSVGLVGLVKAIDCYDMEKNVTFSWYAGRCIENEIRVFLRRKHDKEESLDELILNSNDGSSVKKVDQVISEYCDVEADYERKEMFGLIKKLIEELDGRDREVVKLYFGFYDDVQYTMACIAMMMGMTRANVSRIIQASLKILGERLKQYNVIFGECRVRNWIYNKQEKNNNDLNEIVRLDTIYGYFHNYDREYVDMALSMLSDEERKLLGLRYGENLNEPLRDNKIWRSDLDIIYGIIIPKVRRYLELISVRCLKRVRDKG